MREVSQSMPPCISNLGVPLSFVATNTRMLSPTASVLELLGTMRIVPFMVSVLIPSIDVQPLAVVEAFLLAPITNSEFELKVTLLLLKKMLPETAPLYEPGRTSPCTVTELLPSGLVDLLVPERTAPD